MRKFLKASPGNRLVLVALLTGLISGLANGLVWAQDTGGGSTADFKRPSNPPVHRRPKIDDEPAGGRLTGTAGPKPSGRNPQPREPIVGTPPRATNPETTGTSPRPTGTPKPVTRGRLGGLIGPLPARRPPADQTQSANVLTPAGSEINEEVEDAIEAGNTARDEKPPDYAEAERAYKVAAKLAPSDPRAFEGLGNIYLDQQRNEEAIAAYRKAVELKSKNTQVFEGLGDAYYRLARYAEALEASTESVRLNPKPPGAYWTLTWVNLTIGNGEAAGNMAQAFIYRWRPLYSGTPPYYITFAGYLGYRQAGRKEDADKLLAGLGPSAGCQDQNWICRLLKYLRDEITADQLLAEANDNDKMTEARAYIGIDLALDGRRAEALPHLLWVKENGNRHFVEYHLAEAWIARLEKQ